MHAPWPEKDLNAFQSAIDEIIRDAPAHGNVCNFSHCYFPQNYDCENLRGAFEYNCSFLRATFYGSVDLVGVKLSGRTSFWQAKFYGDANLKGAEFSESVFFGPVQFFEKVTFAMTKFCGDANFLRARFSGGVCFTSAEFHGDAQFMEANFSGEVDFVLANFSGDANFRRAGFSRDTIFAWASFLKSVDFSYVKSGSVIFQDVNCLGPQQVRFHHVDLSRWSFLNTDLRRIDFDDVTWALTRKFLSHRTALFDELNVSSRKDDLASVERLYRHLKKNYESQRDYGRAGDFYYGEMEMKRRQLNAPGQIPFWLYRLMSGYGENYRQALAVLIGMWIVFAVLFVLIGYTDKEMGLSVQRFLTWNPSGLGETFADFARSLIYSAQSMTLFHEPNITFHSVWGQAVELLASILGVIQIALFGLALQRRFKR